MTVSSPSTSQTFVWKASVAKDRWDEVSQWLARQAGSGGFLGASEGGVFEGEEGSEDLEPEFDLAEAPASRDWVGDRQLATNFCRVEVYFSSVESISVFETTCHLKGEWRALEDVDWNATWKASFRGIDLSQGWKIVPPWNRGDGSREIVINPGAGFGTGTHETTRLCLEALLALSLEGRSVLDFGSGSGILAIASRVWGARSVEAVEIDPLALDNLNDNRALNGLAEDDGFQSRQFIDFDRVKKDIVVANILKPVLLDHAELLVARWTGTGCILLSGLLHDQVEETVGKYVEAIRRAFSLPSSGPVKVSILHDGDWSLAKLEL